MMLNPRSLRARMARSALIKNVDLSIVSRLSFDRLAMGFDCHLALCIPTQWNGGSSKISPSITRGSWKMGSGLESIRMLGPIKSRWSFGQAHGWKLKSSE